MTVPDVHAWLEGEAPSLSLLLVPVCPGGVEARRYCSDFLISDMGFLLEGSAGLRVTELLASFFAVSFNASFSCCDMFLIGLDVGVRSWEFYQLLGRDVQVGKDVRMAYSRECR